MNSRKINKSFLIKTLGCKVNQYESQVMREILVRSGYRESASKKADICILNTCTVTHHADKESRYLIGLLRRTNPGSQIAVTGCYVQANASQVLAMPGVSIVFGNDTKPRISEILNNEPPSYREDDVPKITDFKDRNKAFVKIQDGCDSFCSYCAVPFVRSELWSKPIENIVDEVTGLVRKGFREIILTGVCLGSWTGQTKSKESLVDVLRALEKVEGDFRIRLSSIELGHVSDELIGFIAKSKTVCRHLHIPLQSGDDTILRRMNRPYTARVFRTRVKKIASKIKGISLTTDVIVGFPGESDKNFSNTVATLKAIHPLRTHIFTFSRREGTAAYKMGDLVPPEVAKKRYVQLSEAAVDASCAFRRDFINKRVNVLIESEKDRASGMLTGYSDNYIKVLIKGPDKIKGVIAPVVIEEVTPERTVGAYVSK